jgi:hypothetical protein
MGEWANGREGVGWGMVHARFRGRGRRRGRGRFRGAKRGPLAIGYRLLVMRFAQAAVGDGFGGGRRA